MWPQNNPYDLSDDLRELKVILVTMTPARDIKMILCMTCDLQCARRQPMLPCDAILLPIFFFSFIWSQVEDFPYITYIND